MNIIECIDAFINGRTTETDETHSFIVPKPLSTNERVKAKKAVAAAKLAAASVENVSAHEHDLITLSNMEAGKRERKRFDAWWLEHYGKWHVGYAVASTAWLEFSRVGHLEKGESA